MLLRSPAGRGLKRTADVLVGAVLLIAALPVLGVLALAIKLEDRGPVFFLQERLGQGERTFRLLKLRSMVVGADRLPGGMRVRQADPRITRVGRLLRRLSLDELPQLVNVLKGDMSLVGPRPALPRDLERYSPSERRRLQVRPGITGLAQVSGRTALPWRDRIVLDLQYIDGWGPWLDLRILAGTVRCVLRPRAVYPSADPWQGRSGPPGDAVIERNAPGER